MRIVNESRYETAPLRAIIRRVATVELDPSKRKRVTVYIRETKRGVTRSDELGTGCLGWARIGGSRCVLYVPANFQRFDPETFAHVCAHEMGHLRGLRHPEMRGFSAYAWTPDWRGYVRKMGYLDGITVTIKPPKRKPRLTDEDKLARVEANLARWQPKLRRAENAIKKYEKQARYYRRKIEVAAAKEQS